MENKNFFDQFDEPVTQPAPEEEGNFFDQFDEPNEITPGMEEKYSRSDALMDDMNADRAAADREFEEVGQHMQGGSDTTLRSYSDLYDTTLNKYGPRIRQLYEERTGNSWAPANNDEAYNPNSSLFDQTKQLLFGSATEEEEAKLKALEAELQEVYNAAGEEGKMGEVFGFEIPIKGRFQYKTTNNPDWDPTKGDTPENPAMISKRYWVSPPDQNAIMRMSYQVLNNVVAGFGDLATGNITKEGPVGKAIPDMVADGGAEDFTTELTSLVIGPKIAEGVLKGTADGVKYLSKASKGGSYLANKAKSMLSPEAQESIRSVYVKSLNSGLSAEKAMAKASAAARVSIIGMGYALADASIVEDDSEGMIFSKDTIKEVLGVDDRRANDISVMLDTPIIAGAVNTLGSLYQTAAKKYVAQGIGGLRNLEFAKGGLGKLLHQVPGTRITQADAGLKALTFIDPNLQGVPPEEFIARTKFFGDALSRNAVKNIKIAGVQKDFELDSPSALIPALEDYYKLAYASRKADMGEEGFNKWVKTESTESANRLIELRTAIGGNATVMSKTNSLLTGTEDVLSDAANAQSPTGKLSDVQTDAAKTLTRTEDDIINSKKGALDDAQSKFAADQEVLNTALESDPTVRQILEEANATDDFGSTRAIDDRLMASLPEPVYAAYSNLRNASRQAYEEIAQSGAEVDVPRFLEAVQRFGGRVDPETGVIADPFLRNIAESVNQNPDFGNLYNGVRQRLQDEIAGLREGDPRRGQLIGLRRSINDDMYLLDNDPDVQEMAERARTAYATLSANFGRGATRHNQDLGRLGNERAYLEEFPNAGGPGQGVEKFQVEGTNVILDSLEGVPASTNLAALRRAADAGGQLAPVNQALTDYYTGRAAKDLQDMISKGTAATPKTLRNTVKGYITTLDKLDTGLADRLRPIEQRLTDLDDAAKLSEREVAEMQAELNKAIVISENSAAAKFIAEYNPRHVNKHKAVSNPESVIDEIFGSKDSTTQIDALLQKAAMLGEDGNAIRQSLQGSYMDYIRRNITSKRSHGAAEVKDGTTRSAYSFNEANIDKMLNDPTVRRNIKALYADTPEIGNQIDEVLKMGKNINATSKKSADDILGTVPAELDPARATNTVITFVWGVLNPTAARVRRLVGPSSVENLAQVRQVREATLAALITDPKEFAKIIKDSNDKLKNDQAADAFKNLLTRSGIKAYGYEEGQYEGDKFKQEREEE